jgi:hypothetical protein
MSNQQPRPRTVSDLFPREHLIAEDLGGRPHIVTVAAWDVQCFHLPTGDQKKPILRFQGAKKFLILNKTNAETMIRLTGSEVLDSWIGARVQLVPSTINGKETIIIHAAPPAPAPAPAPTPAPTA